MAGLMLVGFFTVAFIGGIFGLALSGREDE